jgi:hypothetical protein
MRTALHVLYLILFCAATGQGLHFAKKGFSYRKMLSLNIDLPTLNLNEETKQILNQPFYYLGRGRQCFAFSSKDDKYVLKIPRTDIYRLPIWTQVLPVHSYRMRLKNEQQKRLKFLLKSLQIACGELSKQTAVIAAHLGTTQSENEQITLIDALGCRHYLSLDKTTFVLQHKKPILMQAFSKALKTDKAKAKEILSAFLYNIQERAELGILNKDSSFLRNYGYENGQAFQIDIGSFFKQNGKTPREVFEKSFIDSTDPIREWLQENVPEMLPYFIKKKTLILRSHKNPSPTQLQSPNLLIPSQIRVDIPN